jgi:hypothetical protein
MKGSGWDEALVKSLIETIDFELRAQLATANLDPAEIQGICDDGGRSSPCGVRGFAASKTASARLSASANESASQASLVRAALIVGTCERPLAMLAGERFR